MELQILTSRYAFIYSETLLCYTLIKRAQSAIYPNQSPSATNFVLSIEF